MNCQYMKKCGGCSLLAMDYSEQLDRKLARVRSLLSPFCPVTGITGMGTPLRYRCKVTATYSFDIKRGIVCGRFAEGTRRVVPVEKCLIEDPRAGAIILTVRDLLTSFRLPPYNPENGAGFLRHVLIRIGKRSGQIMVVLVTGGPMFPSKNNFIKALTKAHPEITTIVQSINDRDTGMILGDRENVLYGAGHIEDILCGKRFRISPRSFFQVNPEQTEKLYAAALDMAGLSGTERVIDAYCGIGTIAISASDLAREVYGVELNRDAVRDAVASKKLNGASNVTFVCADAGEFMADTASNGEKADVVFMDPPRAGSTEKFISSLASLAPEKAVYISCNPVTLASDLGTFARSGYSALTAQCFDMFPQTEHIETVVLLERRG